MAQPLRLFIAIDLPQHVTLALEALQDRLRTKVPRKTARWVRPESIHLTLKFLGDVPEAQVNDLSQGLMQAAAGHSPFELRAESLGVFPNLQKTRILWVGIHGQTDALVRLHASLEQHIAPLGYPTERRPFNPHLTLARAARHASRDERVALGKLADEEAGTVAEWRVEEASLIQSQLKPSGAVYTPLSQARLEAS